MFVVILDYPPGSRTAARGSSRGSRSAHSKGETHHIPNFTLRKMCTQDTDALDTAGGSKLALIGRLTSCLSLKLVLISSFHFLSIPFLTPQVRSCADFFLPDCRLHSYISILPSCFLHTQTLESAAGEL